MTVNALRKSVLYDKLRMKKTRMKVSDIIEAIQTNRVRITDHADEEANSDQLTFDNLVKSRHSRAGGNPSRRRRDTKAIEKTGFPFSRE
jgi:hypothetical protein